MNSHYFGTPSWASNGQRLFTEIQAAEKLRDARLKVTEQQIKRYHTPAYEGRQVDIDSDEYWPHNHYFEFIALVGPQIAYDNPRAKITSQRSARQRAEAKALQFAVNRWIRDSQAYTLNDRILVDFMFGFGVVLTTQRPAPGYDFDDPPHLPQCSRISPARFLMDSQALDAESARFRGHEVLRDKEDLVAEAEANVDGTWNAKAVKLMTTGERGSRLNQPPGPETTERGQLRYYEIWVPEAQLDENPLFSGAIYTIGLGDSATGREEKAHEIRAARPMFGPRWGQYTIYGSYYVPDKPFPLSALTATEGVVQEANLVAQSMSRSAAGRKRIAILDGQDPDAQKIVDAHDGEAVVVEGFDRNKVLELEIGGNTVEQYNYRALVVSNMDRGTGQTDASRGTVTGVGTATENQIAAMAGSARNAYLARRFRDAEAQKLRTVAWYLSEDDRTVMSLGDEAAKEFQQEQPLYLGGRAGTADRAAQAKRIRQAFPSSPITARDLVENDKQDEEHESFDSMDLEVSPYSMRRVDDVSIQQQSNEIVALFSSLAELMVAAPFIDWTELVTDWGEQRGIEDLGRFVNQQLQLQFAAMNIQAMQAGAQPKGQPRKGSDLPEKSQSRGFTAFGAANRQPKPAAGTSGPPGVKSPARKQMASK